MAQGKKFVFSSLPLVKKLKKPKKRVPQLQAPNETNVREALLYALQNDSNPGVRLKALDGLSGFVKQDPRVRDAVLRALISDANPGVRMQVLRLVEPMKADSSVRSVLTRLAETDQNASIRSQARTMVRQMPEMD